MPEPIANSDGQQKQDCEINAAKRFIEKLKKEHPRLGIIIVGDGLFSKGPMIEQVLAEKMHLLNDFCSDCPAGRDLLLEKQHISAKL